MSQRKMSVAGSFYPNSKVQIEGMIAHYNKILDGNIRDKRVFDIKPQAIIVPHAGYIYSAFTANIAFRILASRKPKRVIVIGPSHRVAFKGISIADYDNYETPYGDIEIDKKFVKKLESKFGLKFIPNAHHEHSTEVQMPFIKHYMPEAKVVELVYGDADPNKVSTIIDFCLKQPDTAIVISTDLSHYYNIKIANELDKTCIDAVVTLDTNKLHQECEACGKIGVEAMINSAKKNGLKPILLDYRTSADASGDVNRVVGYMSIAFVGAK